MASRTTTICSAVKNEEKEKQKEVGMQKFLPAIVILMALSPLREPVAIERFSTLTFQWCRTYRDANPQVICRDQLPKRFTIHGWWPDDNFAELSPEDFKMKPIDMNLKNELDREWPDCKDFIPAEEQKYSKGDNRGTSKVSKHKNSQFWEYQWKEHGKKAEMTQLQYLTTALKHAKTYNVNEILPKGYTGGKVSIKGIQQQLKAKFGKEVYITCIQDSRRSWLLHEIKLNISMSTGDIYDYGQPGSGRTNCPRFEDIHLPW